MSSILIRGDGSERVVSFSASDLNDGRSDDSLSRRVMELLDPDPSHAGSSEFHGETCCETLTLDFESIGWLSSDGLNELITINRKARTHGVRLVLANLQDPVRRVFALTRLERMFELAEPAPQTL